MKGALIMLDAMEVLICSSGLSDSNAADSKNSFIIKKSNWGEEYIWFCNVKYHNPKKMIS